LEIQAAWDVLRAPDSRAAYDEGWERQRDEEVEGFIAEEVRVAEMEEEGGGEGRKEGWLLYPCRCGDAFRVPKEEGRFLVRGAGRRETEEGGTEKVQVDGSGGGGGGQDGGAAVVVTCDGCSLRIRVSG
jgi:curved DNA-binding protein CbpA